MLKLLLGDPNARKLKRYQPIVSDINLLEEEVAPLSDDELRGRTADFQKRLANAGSLANQRPVLDEILPEAFAVVREAGKRVLGMRHFDVQLIGGMVLHEGQIAEMKTGEGKTLVATLPSYLNALTGFHLSDLALMQDHATDQLHIEMAHAKHPLTGFAHHSESLRQDLIENRALVRQAASVGKTLLKGRSSAAQFVV